MATSSTRKKNASSNRPANNRDMSKGQGKAKKAKTTSETTQKSAERGPMNGQASKRSPSAANQKGRGSDKPNQKGSGTGAAGRQTAKRAGRAGASGKSANGRPVAKKSR